MARARFGFDASGRLPAVQVRHPEIHQDQVGTMTIRLRNRLQFPFVLRVWEGNGKWAELP